MHLVKEKSRKSFVELKNLQKWKCQLNSGSKIIVRLCWDVAVLKFDGLFWYDMVVGKKIICFWDFSCFAGGISVRGSDEVPSGNEVLSKK